MKLPRTLFAPRKPYLGSSVRPKMRTAHLKLSGGLQDLQTPMQLRMREREAKANEYRWVKLVASAKPTGTVCNQKACPFPAVLNGECRRHALDRHAEASAIPSQMALAAIAGELYGWGG
jgi:hypothetical protein